MCVCVWVGLDFCLFPIFVCARDVSKFGREEVVTFEMLRTLHFTHTTTTIGMGIYKPMATNTQYHLIEVRVLPPQKMFLKMLDEAVRLMNNNRNYLEPVEPYKHIFRLSESHLMR